jgi:predicted nucleotidyltransferase
MTVVEALPAMVARIVSKFSPERISLFGSQAQGDARPDSDVDLLVVLDRVDSKHKAASAIRRELLGLPGAIDVIVSTPDEIARRGHFNGTVLLPALTEGKVLYDRRRA